MMMMLLQDPYLSLGWRRFDEEQQTMGGEREDLGRGFPAREHLSCL